MNLKKGCFKGLPVAGFLLASSVSLASFAASEADLAQLQEQGSCAGCDLRDADLMGLAISSGADLMSADLSGANLYRGSLPGADLRGANLSNANLGHMDFSGADLGGADLTGADLLMAVSDDTTICTDGSYGPCEF